MTPAIPAAYTTFLPLVVNDPPNPYRFGCQVDNDVSGYEQWLIQGYTYQSPYRWMAPDSWLHANIMKFYPNPVIIGTKTCTPVYRLWPDRPGSPPRSEFYRIYAMDVADLVFEYRPWAVELWNEPNVSWDLGSAEDPQYGSQWYYGAWIGEGESSYDGGLRYGDFCRQVYQRIHDAGTLVLAGAIADGDAEFLRGMRDAGFLADAVSFHTYVYKGESFDKIYDRAAELRKYTDLSLFVTETNVIASWDEAPDTQELRQLQADYMSYLFKKQSEPVYTDIDYIGWYALAGSWRWCGMLKDGQPQLAYEVFKAGR